MSPSSSLWERVRVAWRDLDASAVEPLQQALRSPEGQQLPRQVQNAIEAQLTLVAGDSKAARRLLIAASKKRPLDPHEKLVLSFLLIEDVDKATKLIQAVLKSGLRDPRIPEVLGQVAARAGRVEESIKHLRQAVKIDPENWSAFYALGRSFMRLGQAGPAHQAFQALVKLRRDFEEGWLGLAASAVEPAQARGTAQMLAPLVESSATERLMLAYADCLVKAGDMAKAIEAMAPFGEKSDQVGIVLDYVELCMTAGALDRAKIGLQRAEGLDAQQSRLWLFKGQLAELQTPPDVPSALAAYEKAVSLDKKSARLKNALALLLMRPTDHVDFNRAEKLLTAGAKEKSMAGLAAMSNLALLHRQQERDAEAVQVAQRVVALAPAGSKAREQAEKLVAELSG